jgi:hypothetical protein
MRQRHKKLTKYLDTKRTNMGHTVRAGRLASTKERFLLESLNM